MRLRLTVQRNGLPAANIVWNVPDTNSSQAYTITRLLEDVNNVIPLEAEHWGLEHYVVEVGGFECLHFSPVAQSLKEDDHVTIRPLMTAEERARTLTGRHQISEDGRHLVDGVPFGRPYLRHPSRPAVRIPPRKRRRLEATEEVDAGGVAGLLMEREETSPSPEANLMSTNDSTSVEPVKEPTVGGASKTVHFGGAGLDEDEDSDEDDSDFGTSDDSEADSESDSDADSDADSDSSSAASTSDASSSTPSSDNSSSDSDSESDTDSDSDASAPPEVMSSKGVTEMAKVNLSKPPKIVAPGQGRSTTQTRNARRSRSNRLRFLKQDGRLPPDATLKDMAQYEEDHYTYSLSQPEPSRPFSTYAGKRKRVDEEEGGSDDPEPEQRKQELIARLGASTESTMVPIEEPLQQPAEPAEDEQTPKKEMAKKRLRPDVKAISRILVRQAMPSTKKPSKTKQLPEQSPEPEGASDPDFWKSKINLSAFECWDEEFELTAPPFPFKQHWDPASKLMREKADKKKQKKAGKKKRESPPAQDEEEERIYLDYDDTGATENPESETAVAIEDQLRQDVATAAQSDLPPLPEDVSTLPTLNSSDIKEGAIIVCKFFAVNPITVTPEISDYKTALVDREGDSGNGAGTIRLKIAERDLPKREKKVDSKGERIYHVADRFYMDDEEEDDSIWEGHFSELLEPKLLKTA